MAEDTVSHLHAAKYRCIFQVLYVGLCDTIIQGFIKSKVSD